MQLLRTFYLAYREFRQDFCFERAAALTFTTIVSLLPLAVLFLSILSRFLKEEELQNFVRGKVLTYFTTADIQPVMEKWVHENIRTVNFQPGVGLDLLALTALIVSAMALLVSSERVFNRIWKLRGTRNYFQKFVVFWMILTTSPVLVGASFFIDSYIGREGTVIHNLMENHLAVKALYGFLVPIIISCSAFTLMNLFLPYTEVRFFPALLGGCIAGLLWEGLKNGFYIYFGRAAALQTFYESMAAVPIFLFFVYLTWVIILWGGEVSFANQNLRALIRIHLHRQRGGKYSQFFLGLFLLDRLVKSFERGEPVPTLLEVAGRLDLQPEEFQPAVAKLVDFGILVDSPGADGRPLRYVLSRSPGTIYLKEIAAGLMALEAREEWEFDSFPALTAVAGNTAPGAGGSVPGNLAGILGACKQAYLEKMSGLTLKDLVNPSMKTANTVVTSGNSIS